MPESSVHTTCKCPVCFCRAGMCSEVEAQQCASAFTGMLKGTALLRSLAGFKVGLDASSNPFLWSCNYACFIEEECAQSSVTIACLCTITMEAMKLLLQCS